MGNSHEILTNFYRTIWQEEKGYVYLALKDPISTAWEQRFFEWPVDESLVVQTTLNERTSKEVYFAPSLFRERSSKKENVLGAYCFWLEFDGKLPVEYGEVPDPSMIVQTSTETHQHIYWCVDQLMEKDRIESVNRSLAYSLGADISGWDANQVLRPPETLNHKKQLKASLVLNTDRVLNSVAFSNSIVINLPPKLEFEGPLPTVEDTLSKYSLPTKVWELFKNGVTVDRSAGLMSLGYSLAELNLTNAEIMSVLLHADNRWGKFAKRNDQLKRLTEIVTRARMKYPWKAVPDTVESQIITIGVESFLAQDIKIEWLWHSLLEKEGYLLITGPINIGKSQLSLDLAAHLALGKEFLGRIIDRPRKTLFISLEMGQSQLHYVLNHQIKTYSEEERKDLEKMFRIEVRGYPIYFNRLENKQLMEELIEREKIECIIFDSLGSMTEQELSKESDAKNLMDWNDIIRVKYGISTVIIHHLRKAQAGNKTPNTTSDIYGSQYFGARTSSILILSKGKKDNIIMIDVPKVRLSEPIAKFAIKRKDDLTFEITNERLIIIDDEINITDESETQVITPIEGFEF